MSERELRRLRRQMNPSRSWQPDAGTRGCAWGCFFPMALVVALGLYLSLVFFGGDDDGSIAEDSIYETEEPISSD